MVQRIGIHSDRLMGTVMLNQQYPTGAYRSPLESLSRSLSTGKLKLRASLCLCKTQRNEKIPLLNPSPPLFFFPFSLVICYTFPGGPFIKQTLLRDWPTLLTWPSAPTRTSKHSASQPVVLGQLPVVAHLQEGHGIFQGSLLTSYSFSVLFVPLAIWASSWECPEMTL